MVWWSKGIVGRNWPGEVAHVTESRVCGRGGAIEDGKWRAKRGEMRGSIRVGSVRRAIDKISKRRNSPMLRILL
jgi:hypothetical protein